MEGSSKDWGKLSLSNKEEKGYVLPKVQRKNEFMVAAKVIFVLGFYDKLGLENDKRPGKGGHGKPVVSDSSDTAAQREENSNMEMEEIGEALMTNLNHDGATVKLVETAPEINGVANNMEKISNVDNGISITLQLQRVSGNSIMNSNKELFGNKSEEHI
ncbi:hypothetical protein CFP56_028630 [Quercus suber]|uniref:Uncharacterized protein n=1 Tax=Quercus suber TaxID=58331 RepID=A0AAW0JT04_QUESU